MFRFCSTGFTHIGDREGTLRNDRNLDLNMTPSQELHMCAYIMPITDSRHNTVSVDIGAEAGAGAGAGAGAAFSASSLAFTSFILMTYELEQRRSR